MNRLAAWFMGMVMMGLVSAALGQEIKELPVPPDRSTPRGTLKVLSMAMEKGDAQTLRSILAASTPAEQEMAEAMVQTAIAVRKLHDAAINIYGEEQARVLTGTQSPASEASLAYLDEATETLDAGETVATVSFPDVEARPVKLIKQDKQWQVPVGELARDLDEEALRERLEEIRAFNAIFETMAEEITQKKHRTADEAKQALYNRMMQAAAPQATPATQPTSAPTTQPEQ